jgi:16S rRNA (uracil1498-N3)-methyltransferase
VDTHASEGRLPDGSGGPHVFVDDLDAPVISDDDHRHLAKSLRLGTGDPITMSDGQGWWCAGRFADIPEPTGEPIWVPTVEPEIAIGFVVPKGDRPSWIVQKLTELGVDRIIPLHADHSVVRWDAPRRERNQAKLQRVVREAAMQSRQVRMAKIEPVQTVSELVPARGVAMADMGGRAPSLLAPTVLIGPEGGWSAEERGLDVVRVSLGASILRAETAAVAAGVALTFLRAKLVTEHSA